MNKLPTEFSKDTFTFVQVKRNDKAAIYARQNSDGSTVDHNVFAVKTSGNDEVYPNEVAFGVWAWAPQTLERAETYFNRITSGETIIPDVDPVTGSVNNGPDVDLDSMPDVNEDPNIPRPVPPIAPLLNIPISTEPEPVMVETPAEEADPVQPPVISETKDGGATVEVAKVKRGRVAASITFPSGEFTKIQFAEHNEMQTGNAYVRLMNEIKAGRVKLVRNEKLTAGRGRPTAIYSAVV